MYRIIHYREKCIGCNACVEALPSRWRVSRKDGKCTLVGAKEKKGIYNLTIGEDEIDAMKLGAKNCPVNIIKVQEL